MGKREDKKSQLAGSAIMQASPKSKLVSPKCSIGTLKSFLVVAALIALVISTAYFIWRYRTIDRGMTLYEANEIRITSVTLLFEHVRNLGTVSVALLGSLWGLWLLDKNIQLKTWRCYMTFWTTTTFFLGSIFVYSIGHNFLLDRMFNYMTIDFDSPIVQLWQLSQLTFFVCGILSAILTILVCYTKPEDPSGGTT